LQQAMHGCDVVYHAAGYYTTDQHAMRPAMRQAAREIRAVIDIAKQAEVRRLIYTSSLSTVGAPPAVEHHLADERDLYLPGSAPSAYFEAKWLMETEARLAAQDGLEVIILIPSAVFGPEDIKPTTSELLLHIARRRIPFGIDVNTNFVDGRDVAQAHIAAAAQGESGRRYLICGHNLNVAAMISEASRIAGVKAPKPVISHRSAIRLINTARILHLPVPDLMFGIEHFRALNGALGWQTFGFTPRPFDETVRDTLDWFRKHNYL
jgi:dihydroflavonol-4-reductase